MTYLTEESDEKKELLKENLLKQRLSIASFIIGIVSLSICSCILLLLWLNVQIWIPEVWGLSLTCIFTAVTLTGFLLGIISLKKGKKVFAILGCIFNGLMTIFLGWAIYGFIYFMTTEAPP
jgi:hypothetical protein